MLNRDNVSLRIAEFAVEIAVAVARYSHPFDESKVKRGQPENAGEFASKEGGGSTEKPKPLHVITGDIHEIMAAQEAKSQPKPKSLWETMGKAETPKAATKPDKQPEKPTPSTNSAGVPMVAPRRLPDGRPVGPAIVDVSQLKIDPERFQYKVSGINAKTGTDTSLKSVDKYDPTLGGSMLVWEDPEDGQTYVVNGHHRHEIANRSSHWEGEVGTADEGSGWSGEMQVHYLPAKTAKEARAAGALANIAEGHGTPIDAAKYLRDSGSTLEDLKKKHVSTSGEVARVALSLAKLSDTMFQKLTNGRMTVGRAEAIATHLPSHEAQEQLFGFITKRESGGKKTFSDGKVAEMARATAAVKPVATAGKKGLFDDWFETQPVEQRADVADHVRRHLSGTFRTFKEASSDRRKGLLESTGANVLDTEGNQKRADSAELAVDDFEHRSNAAGDQVALILNLYAEKLFHEPRKSKAILDEALGAVRKQFDIERGPVGESASADGSGEELGANNAGGPDSRRGDSEHSVSPGRASQQPELVSKFSRATSFDSSPLADALTRACRRALSQCG